MKKKLGLVFATLIVSAILVATLVFDVAESDAEIFEPICPLATGTPTCGSGNGLLGCLEPYLGQCYINACGDTCAYYGDGPYGGGEFYDPASCTSGQPYCL